MVVEEGRMFFGCSWLHAINFQPQSFYSPYSMRPNKGIRTVRDFNFERCGAG
jgi:hypothetical protein